MKKYNKKGVAVFLILCLLFFSLDTNANVIRHISVKKNTKLAALTVKLQKAISKSTPAESAGSDLKIIHPATRLSTARLPQSYAFDGTCYYFLSQLSTGSNSSRLTRIRFREDGTYESAFMTLKYFGHGTNLDCVRHNGKTWIWTGCNSKHGESSEITCFFFRAGKTLYRHGKRHYRIPVSRGSSAKAINVYPAIDPSGKNLAVRFIRKGKQVFQFYDLIHGNTIHPKKIKKRVRIKKTKGPFQGFDILGTKIYTIEGTACRSEMRKLKKRYYPIRLRIYDYKSRSSQSTVIRGASKLSHREPEGIQLKKNGDVIINIASHYKKLYTCVNLYQRK